MKRQTHWHVEDIKGELRKRYGSLSALSRAWGLNPRAISGALSKPGTSRKLERRIAAAIEQPVHVIWPERWASDGSPISFRVDRTPSRTAADAQRAKARAA